MRIGRSLPPAAAPLEFRDLWHGVLGLVRPRRALGALEDSIRQRFGVTHVFPVSSGTAGLALILAALRASSSRTEVVIPAYTCFSVPAAVLSAGLRPVPCDVNATTLDFEPAQLEQALSANTLCVVVHHLFGIAADVERTRARCRPRGIPVVEDAAQAMGVTAHGGPAGTLGEVGVFSFGRGKNVTCGGGGLVVTNSDSLAEIIRGRYRALTTGSVAGEVIELAGIALMCLFIRPGLYWIPGALPFLRLGETIFPEHIRIARLSGMKAGLLRRWVGQLTRANRCRSAAAEDLSRRLGLAPPSGPRHPYLRLPMLAASAADKAWLVATAGALGLGIGRGYPTPISEIPQVRRVVGERRFAQAQRVAERLVTLPTHEWVTDRDTQAIAACVRRAVDTVSEAATTEASPFLRSPAT